MAGTTVDRADPTADRGDPDPFQSVLGRLRDLLERQRLDHGARGDLFFKLFGLPFLAIGLYLIFGRFWLDTYLRGRLRYTVTDRRVLIQREGGRSIKSLDIKRLPALEFDERTDGTGTIRFDPSENWFGGRNFGAWQPALDQVPQFIRIDNARQVYQLIQRQAHS